MLASGKNTQAAPGATLPDDIKEEFILMKRRILSALAALALLLTMCPLGALAADTDGDDEIIYLEDWVDLGSIETSALQTVYSLRDTNPVPKTDGKFEKWINRIDWTKYPDVEKFYETLVKASDNADDDDVLIDVTKGTKPKEDKENYYIEVTTISGTLAANETLSTKLGEVRDDISPYVRAAVDAFDRDHPEVFWLDGNSSLLVSGSAMGSEYKIDVLFPLKTEANPENSKDAFDIRATEYQNPDTIKTAITARDTHIKTIRTAATGSSRLDKVTAFNEWLTKHNEYNTGNLDNGPHDMRECVSALEGRIGTDGPVCEGYARAFKVLCDKESIPCILVDGQATNSSSESEGHMWNYVQMENNNWYAVDVTWNDPTGGKAGAESGSESDKWLLVGSDTEISGQKFINSHPVENRASENGVSFTNQPDLNATAYPKTPTPYVKTAPTATATYGDTLGNATLNTDSAVVQVSKDDTNTVAGTWAWVDNTKDVGDVGTNKHLATFTPEKTDIFNVVNDIEVTVTVEAKNLTDVAIDAIANQTYAGKAIEPTLTVTADSRKTTLSVGKDYTVEYSNNINAGQNTATVTVKKKDGSNYTFSDETANFTIIPADYTFEKDDIEGIKTSQLANGTDHPTTNNDQKGKGVTINGAPEEVAGTLEWFKDEGCNTPADGTFNIDNAEEVTGADYGYIKLYWKFTPTNSNYTGAKTGETQFQIMKFELQNVSFATPTSVTKTYGDEPFTNKATNSTEDGGDITYASDNTDVATVDETTGEVTIVGAGEATITATAAGVADKYSTTSESYTLTVKRKEIQIVLAFADPSKTEYIYENVEITPEVKVTVTGSDPEKVLAQGTDYTVEYTNNNAVGTATVKVVPAGNYTWDENVELTFEIKEKTPDPVNPDPTLQTQNITFPENEVKKTYGDADFTYAINADSTGRTITYASSDAAIATVTNAGVVHIVKPGTVTITATAAQNATYAEASASYTLTIDKATVTITAANKSAYVGDSAPTLGSGDYTITGLVGDDKLVGDVNIAYASTPDMSRTGTVSIQVSGGTVPDADKYNTAIQYVYGTLTISTRSTSSSSSSGGGGKRRPSSSRSSTPTQTPTKNPQTGAVVETTTTPDGSRTQVTTETDGTVSTRITDANGSVSCEVSIPSGVHEKSLPISSLRATKDSANAPTLTIFAQADVKVKVPVSNLTPGVVAIVVGTNGQQEILKTSVPETDGLSFTAHGDVTIKIVDNSKTFSDVKASDWHKNAVDFASARSLFNGTSNTTFSPESPMTRGMLAMVLHNLEDNPPAASNIYFPDVAAGAWYADAVRWASAKGIISGYDNGQVGAEDDISREQLAVILWRYAGSPAASSSTLNFTDAAMASDYATSALSWATEAGIISGTGNGALSPKAQASRAQVAQMLKNFITVMN